MELISGPGGGAGAKFNATNRRGIGRAAINRSRAIRLHRIEHWAHHYYDSGLAQHLALIRPRAAGNACVPRVEFPKLIPGRPGGRTVRTAVEKAALPD